MGFWNIFFGKKPATESNVRIMGEMIIGDQSYLLSELQIDFCRDLDNKNHPDGNLRVDTMTVTIKAKPDKLLTRWAISPSIVENGEVHFYSYEDSISLGALFSIRFKDAKCLGISREKAVKDKADHTMIAVSPGSITFGNEEL